MLFNRFPFVGMIVLFFLLLFGSMYFESNTRRTRVEYFDVPCLNKTTEFVGELKVKSISEIGYVSIAKYELEAQQDGHEELQDSNKIIHGGTFTFVGYDVEITEGPLSGLGGGSIPYYLVEDNRSHQKYWVSYFMVDATSCKLVKGFSDNAFNVLELTDKSFRKKEIQLAKLTFMKQLHDALEALLIVVKKSY